MLDRKTDGIKHVFDRRVVAAGCTTLGGMSYFVVGTRSGSTWDVEIDGVGRTSATELSEIEAAARAMLAAKGHADAGTADLQLLMPDFEVDLHTHGIPGGARPHRELVAGVIALVVAVGAIAFAVGLLL